MNSSTCAQGPKRTPTCMTHPIDSVRTWSSLNQEEHPLASLSDLATEETQTHTHKAHIHHHVVA